MASPIVVLTRAARSGAWLFLPLLSIGCGCRVDVAPDVPAFARDLPGRAAVVAWSEHGEAVPEAWADTVADWTSRCQLRLVEGAGWSALVVPDRVTVGWPSLAESRTFAAALKEMPTQADTKVFVDLEQLVEAVSGLSLPPPLGMVSERAVAAFDLRALRFAALGLVRSTDGGVTVSGTITTSGVRTGLPGLLTVPTAPAPLPPEPSAATGVIVDGALAPEAMAQVVRAMVITDERTSMLEGMMVSPLRTIAGAVDTLSGRVHAELSGVGRMVAGVTIRDEAALKRQLAELPGAGAGGRRPWRIEGGWLVLSANDETFEPPQGGQPLAGPFLRVVFGRVGSGGGTVMLQRIADDAVGVSVELRPER